MLPTLFLLLACVDYDLGEPEDASAGTTVTPPNHLDTSTPGHDDPPAHTGDTGQPVDSDPPEDDPPEDDGPPWDYLNPPTGQPPGKTRSSCADGTAASFSPGEIYVLSWSSTTASGVLHAPEMGWYHVFNQHVAESGASQRNESAFFRVPNATHPSGKPRWSNCGDDWVLPDHDNGGATALYHYVGTFWLDAGENRLEMHHFCPDIRAGACAWMHDKVDSDKTCDSDNPNSVHFNGDGLCVTTAN